MRELHADGVTLLANVGGRYLGTPEWDVLFEELDALGCVVFVHPNVLPATPLPGIMPGTVDFLADTTRAAVNLIAHDYLSRYPSVTFILSHGGGYLPYAALRVAASLPGQDGEGEQQRIDRILGQLGQFWFDTALTGGPALPTLLAFAGPDRITFGSDHPFAGRDKSLYFTAALDNALASNDIDSGLAHAVARGNAERLFPRLARRFHCDDVVVTQEVLQANEKHGSRDLTEPVA